MIRKAWANYALLAALVVAGAAGGLYLSGGWTSSDPADQQPAPISFSQRFTLTQEDARDTGEAPSIAIAPGGKVYLAWASRTGPAERSVFLTTAAAAGQTFDAPRAISKGGIYKTPARGKSGGHERKALPHVDSDGKTVYLSWSEALPNSAGMQMLLATSGVGTAFDQPGPVHRGASAKATFSSMALGSDGALACAWLDDRGGNQQVYASIRPAGAAVFEEEQLVHGGEAGKGVCPCCPTAAAFAPDGTLYVAFRNIHDGYRDIAICRRSPGAAAFEGPFPVVTDTWKFDGCPHDGPSMAFVGGVLHITWMDARSGSPRCYHASAKTSEMKFEARELHPLSTGSQGNAKLFATPEGTLHAVWEESLTRPAEGNGHQHGPPKSEAGSSRLIMHATLPPGGREFGGAHAVATATDVFQTRPAIAGTPDGRLLIAWNELSTQGKSVVVTLATGGRP